MDNSAPHPLGQLVRLAPSEWPAPAVAGNVIDVRYSPSWNDPLGPTNGGSYWNDEPSSDAILGAPLIAPGGGTIYFDGALCRREDFEGALRLMEVHTIRKNYAVFLAQASDPEEERYLSQIRLISEDALASRTEITEKMKLWIDQPVGLGELLWQFIEVERRQWRGQLASLPWDGSIQLGFGFMAESSFQGVYRLWSRAWVEPK